MYCLPPPSSPPTCSNGLTEFITALGGKHLRFKRGYKNVISKGVELNKAGEECHLMMETRCVGV